MHKVLDEFVENLPEREPLTYKAIYPKRIVPPHGYLNPKYFSITLWSELRLGFDAEMNMLPHTTGLVNALMHLKYRVPTYFVRSEFAQAVAQTEPPSDFKFSEIKWPLPAMLFVLPTEFVMSYFGYMCPFLSITSTLAGVYPTMLKNLPPCNFPIYSVNPISNEVDRFSIVYPVYGKDQMPVDYTGTYPTKLNVSDISSAPFHDATYMEEQSEGLDFDSQRSATDMPAEGEPERLFNNKVQSFAVKLMLALTARPNFISVGTLARPMKMKRGRITKLELWHPNLIGWDYRAKRIDPVSTADVRRYIDELPAAHASPRMHWRRGHMRNQPFGPKPWTETTTKRLMWIEPVLVNALDEKQNG